MCLLVAMLPAASAAPKKTINISSDPPGARVEINGADLGVTPTTYTLETNPQGEFLGSWVNAPLVEFIAYPPAGTAGLYKQTKTFRPNGFFKAGDKIPDKIFFDLRVKSTGELRLPDEPSHEKPQVTASSSAAPQHETNELFEYATLRWAGRENTHVIRPSGEVDFIGMQLSRFKKPERADDRSFYMNIALNGLAKEGYELVLMTPDDYVMKRRVAKH